MATVTFYEKPGCINNTKQKALLQAAGHSVRAQNLLTEPWTLDKLRLFFSDRCIENWFNPTAPAIKSGQVKPTELDAETALNLMIQDPLLIRRPLMQVSDRYMVGFDPAIVHAWIGLNLVHSVPEDVETCPHTRR